MAEQTATHDWHTRALVRVIETTVKRSVDPYREYTFRAGEEVEMIQWGRAGRPVDHDAWWSSYDIDSALIIEASNVEIVTVLEETNPFEPPSLANIGTSRGDEAIDEWLARQDEDEGGPELRQCPYCYQMHQPEHIEWCPLNPHR